MTIIRNRFHFALFKSRGNRTAVVIASAAKIITYAREISVSENTAIRAARDTGKNPLDEIEIVSGVKFAAADSLIELLIYSVRPIAR